MAFLNEVGLAYSELCLSIRTNTSSKAADCTRCSFDKVLDGVASASHLHVEASRVTELLYVAVVQVL